MTDNYNIDYKEEGNILNMKFSGQLTINSIDKITESVKNHINDPEKINIMVADAENIDLTFLQLIHSIINQGGKKGYEVETKMDVSEDLKSLIINAGFGKLLNQNKNN
ncbi:hypothetical protein QA597_03405 [Marinilabiliaceae bacterium ANBcel2]|nr:hypothetical protein [Marinilabiliaceae bacterium ANBcel2]